MRCKKDSGVLYFELVLKISIQNPGILLGLEFWTLVLKRKMQLSPSRSNLTELIQLHLIHTWSWRGKLSKKCYATLTFQAERACLISIQNTKLKYWLLIPVRNLISHLANWRCKHYCYQSDQRMSWMAWSKDMSFIFINTTLWKEDHISN